MIESFIYSAINTAYEAGLVIMEVYQNEFDVEYKSDNSPLTLADKRAHDLISSRLFIHGIPILSEEGKEIPYSVRKEWTSLWMVDPLDGTKEFINRNGDFTVNIALIENNHPIAGVIYAPVPDLLYYALPGYGAFRISGALFKQIETGNLGSILSKSDLLPDKTNPDQYLIVASRSHQNAETAEYINSIMQTKKDAGFLARGSSLKFCAVAEGSANIYPRMGPTMEWDTAAGHAIAVQAGCKVTDPSTMKPLIYNKENLLNSFFVVERS
jgi:3'(2'), 5'-bisphosphate nucleotidase